MARVARCHSAAEESLGRNGVYPDSVDEDDCITYAYNRQQQVTSVTDQNGTVHEYDYDKLGRQIEDRVATLGSGVDGTVRRISTEYEVRGMKSKITSYDNPTVGSGTVLNQSQFVYNDFGQLVTEYQSHGGAVNTSTTPKVQYTFADGSNNMIRPTGLVYPNGRVIDYTYGGAGSLGDRCSRVAAIEDGATTLAGYSYLGRRTFVEQDDTEPQMKWTLVDLNGSNDPDTGDIYSGFDRFSRIKDNRWYNYDSETDVDRIQYGYDRAGNRIWRKNVVAESLGKKLDELYDYDAIHRLKDLDRGTLTALKDAINDPQFAECWSLDSTGNWSGYKQSDDGSGWSLEQSRAANTVNEISNISETTGPSWVTPVYNRAGNMTTMHQPNDPTQSYTATYDAWNRLVQIADGVNAVSEYSYDGAKRRIVQQSYTGGILSETRHLYYTEPSMWQVIEERVGNSPDFADAERQFVWGLRYVDGLIIRDRDTDGNGILNERFYACQDANWNVTAINSGLGTISGRFSYTAYGMPAFLTPEFVSEADLTFDWETLFSGYRWDDSCSLFHVRHRVYHPILGSWTQRDPLGLSAGTSLYQYANSSPLLLTDPSGLVCETEFWTWIALVLLVTVLVIAIVISCAFNILVCIALAVLAFLADQALCVSPGVAQAGQNYRDCMRRNGLIPPWPIAG